MRGLLVLGAACAVAIALPGLGGCSSLGLGEQKPAPAAASEPAAAASAPDLPTGAALGGILGGPVGASLSEADRQGAYDAQVGALESGQRRSWRGARGVFGFVEPGADSGGGCRPYAQTIYIDGRPRRGEGVGCRQADGTWKMTR